MDYETRQLFEDDPAGRGIDAPSGAGVMRQ
jgi:hypothetical protein